jgi:Icc-related predicted phosphoesterase
MRIQIVSDLHIEEWPLEPFAVDADVLVLAGDIHSEPEGLRQWLRRMPHVPIVMVLGNHEYDHKQFDRVLPAFRAAVAEFPNLHLLELERADIGGVTFLGANMWTDMRGGLDAPPIARVLKAFDMRGVTVDDLMAEHRTARSWLESAFPKEGKRVVVITHTAPSFRSQHPRFENSPLNGFFASAMDEVVERLGPQLWVHGHMHDPVDYTIGRTRVISNPRGYQGENPGWNPFVSLVELA